MLFSSLVFLFVFLPAILIVYYLSPGKVKNFVLLFFSILFYAWGGVSYSLILIGSILLNFLFAFQIQRSADGRKAWLTIGIVFNVLLLVVFKYLNFFLENIDVLWLGFLETSLLPEEVFALPHLKILLPLGISFFTFQQMSMLWDVYRNPEGRKISFWYTALYVSFFPQLIAGPIVRHNDIIDQIQSRKKSPELFASGIRKFILGLFKKVIFANNCAILADSIMDQGAADLTTPIAWLGIIAYSFQIYFDFSGYSDMAIGLGRMFGFKIFENFDFPYLSKSIKEFWRRWHISLSSWFRDYVYIPIGGNRMSPARTYLNLFIVFFLTGFWHGASWSFVFWGLFHGTFLVIERLGFERLLKKIPGVFSRMYMLLIVMVGWVFFRIEAFPDAAAYTFKLFGVGETGKLHLVHFLDGEKVVILALALVASTRFFEWTQNKLRELAKGSFEFLINCWRISCLS